MTAEQRVPQRRSLQQLLTLLDEDDADGALLDLVFESAERRDPELPGLLRACAIPRKITAEIVGVLRGTPADDAGNRRLLDLVYAHTFVISRPSGGYVYHDATREYLLADWKSSEEKRARFATLNKALAEYYKVRYADSQRDERLLIRAATPIAEGSPERLGRLSAAIEASMGASLHEVTYHLLLASEDEALDFFRSVFYDLERAGKVTITQTLISFMRGSIQSQPKDGSEHTLPWLDYFNARIQRVYPGYDPGEQEATLSRLASADAPSILRRWALDDLAQVYMYQLDARAALRTRHQLADLPYDPEDAWNDPLRFLSLGNLYVWLGDNAQAIRHLREGIARSDDNPLARKDLGTLARLDLAGVHAELSEWNAAFAVAAEALCQARTVHYADVAVPRVAATRLAQLLSTFDAPASDCAIAEAITIAQESPDDLPAAFIDRIDLLLAADRAQTAQDWITRAESERYSPRAPLIRFDLAYRRGFAAEFTADYKVAESIYSGLLADLPDRVDTGILRTSVRARRGKMRLELGDIDGAIADFENAREEWERRGLTVDAASATAQLASAMTRGDGEAAARGLFEAAEAAIPGGTTVFSLILAQAQATAAAHLGQWEAARAHRQRALDIAIARRDGSTQATNLRKLAEVHAALAEPSLAAECTQRAAEAERQVAAADAARPTEAQQQAHRNNGAGIREFSRTDDRSGALENARRSFAQAAELDPGNLWPVFNLSCAYAEQEAWEGASTALARALDLSPAPLRHAPALADRLVDYTRSHLQTVLEGETPWQAKAMAATAALEFVAHRVPDARLTPLRALQALALALAGDPAARDACRAALASPSDGDPGRAPGADSSGTDADTTSDPIAAAFADAVAPFIDTVARYWAVDDTLRALLADDVGAQTVATNRAATTRDLLRPRLDAILSLDAGSAESAIPIVTPIVVEIGADLRPIVDPALDGGVFFERLIPGMRDRIAATTGVTIPGVRARPNESLAARTYRVFIEEVQVRAGSVPASASVRRLDPAGGGPGSGLIDFHPVTGEPGLWVVTGTADDEPSDWPAGQPDSSDILSPAACLLVAVESAIRPRLARFLGPQEVTVLAEGWADEDAEAAVLVSAVLPDLGARLQLSWLLQSLATDGVPGTDWRMLLAAIRDAGGLDVGTQTLRRAVRLRLPALLPGPQTGRKPVLIPAHYEEALAGRDPGLPHTTRVKRRLEFQAWLHQAVTDGGPAITLVARTAEGREAAAPFARLQDPLITTLTQDELAAGAVLGAASVRDAPSTPDEPGASDTNDSDNADD